MGLVALHDHFGPPLFPEWDWHGFPNGWASNIAAALNEVLPPEYHAQPKVQFGIEIDVATIERRSGLPDDGGIGASNATPWTAPAPALTVPLPVVSGVVEVLVRGGFGAGPLGRRRYRARQPRQQGSAVASGCVRLKVPGLRSKRDRLGHGGRRHRAHGQFAPRPPGAIVPRVA
jgi:hypothetical protein